MTTRHTISFSSILCFLMQLLLRYSEFCSTSSLIDMYNLNVKIRFITICDCNYMPYTRNNIVNEVGKAHAVRDQKIPATLSLTVIDFSD